METLFIDRKGSVLSVDSGRLRIRTPDNPRPCSLPLRSLGFIAISTQVELSSTVLLALSAADVTLVLINPRKADQCLTIHALNHGAIERRLHQARVAQDPSLTLTLAKRLIKQKLLGYYRVTLRCRRARPDLRRPMTQVLQQTKLRYQQIQQAETLDSLRGYEGAAAWLCGVRQLRQSAHDGLYQGENQAAPILCLSKMRLLKPW